jgi:hypothetical protein
LVGDKKGNMVIKGVINVGRVKNENELLKLWREKKKMKS